MCVVYMIYFHELFHFHLRYLKTDDILVEGRSYTFQLNAKFSDNPCRMYMYHIECEKDVDNKGIAQGVLISNDINITLTRSGQSPPISTVLNHFRLANIISRLYYRKYNF